MKLKPEYVDKFLEVVQSCEGDIYLTDWRNQEKYPDFCLNLKSELSMQLGLAQLLGSKGDWFELYVTKREDEAKIMEFIRSIG